MTGTEEGSGAADSQCGAETGGRGCEESSSRRVVQVTGGRGFTALLTADGQVRRSELDLM